MKTLLPLLVLANVLTVAAWAQSGPAASSAQAPPAANKTDSDEEPDVPVAKPAQAASATVEEQNTAAWNMLTQALGDTRTQAEVTRIDAINALGLLGDFPVAQSSLRDAEKDQDRYIRLAAVAAMGSSKKPVFLPDLKQALKDSAPEVSFAAAVGLWKMDDKSGETILNAVLAGDRKANRGLATAEKHEAGQDLHSPSKLAAIGAEQGAYAVLGPFGFALGALRRGKGQNGIEPRVIAATLLAENKSDEAMKTFVDLLDDPDPAVRTTAARALGEYHTKQVTDALGDAFYDSKPQVRFTAAASYIRATQPQPEHKVVQRRKTAIHSAHQRSATPTEVTQ
jgi:HEAT repeat protein